MLIIGLLFQVYLPIQQRRTGISTPLLMSIRFSNYLLGTGGAGEVVGQVGAAWAQAAGAQAAGAQAFGSL